MKYAKVLIYCIICLTLNGCAIPIRILTTPAPITWDCEKQGHVSDIKTGHCWKCGKPLKIKKSKKMSKKFIKFNPYKGFSQKETALIKALTKQIKDLEVSKAYVLRVRKIPIKGEGAFIKKFREKFCKCLGMNEVKEITTFLNATEVFYHYYRRYRNER